MGGRLENFKYFTIFSLFNTDKLIKGDFSGIIMIIVLLVIGVLFYLIGILRFSKRELPL